MAEIIDSLIVLLQINQESDLVTLFTLENSGPYINFFVFLIRYPDVSEEICSTRRRKLCCF